MSSRRKTKRKRAGRVVHIGVSRLYSLGNYENVKYELGAEVPAGASATETLRELVNTLSLLKPIRTPGCMDQFKRVSKKTEAEQSAYEKENLPHWREEIEMFAARKLRRDEAVLRLDALGGTSKHTDAKEKWDDSDDVPF